MDELIAAARAARERAYAPYSGFRVGAALRTADGRIFTGCNVENASYGLTNCAERTAIFQAVAAGCRDFAALAVFADSDTPLTPCGACRQVMAEFSPEMTVIMAAGDGSRRIATVRQLLPGAFDRDSMKCENGGTITA